MVSQSMLVCLFVGKWFTAPPWQKIARTPMKVDKGLPPPPQLPRALLSLLAEKTQRNNAFSAQGPGP